MMSKKRIELINLIQPAFYKIHRQIHNHEFTHFWFAGGRGSTKSSKVSIDIPLLLIKNPSCHAVVLRRVGNTLRNSVYPQIGWGINSLGLSNKFDKSISPLEFTYKKTGQKIFFLGCDDEMKIKSFKPPFGYVGMVWFEECNQFVSMEQIRSLLQSLLRGGSKYWVFYSYNPPKSRDNWVNLEVLHDEPDKIVNHSSYLTVPREWLGEQFILEAEKLKNKNYDRYRHEYLGEVTGNGGNVFDNVEDIRLTDKQIYEFDRLRYGIDFGFSIDPLAFTAMQFDAKHENLYIFDEIYQQKLKNSTLARMIKPKYKGALIYADSAEPKSIAELRDYGLNIIGAKKGPDSVEYGIKFLQDLNRIYIDRKRCPNTYKEFIKYEYEINKNGEFISAYPDKDNHSIDSARYGLNDLITKRKLKVANKSMLGL